MFVWTEDRLDRLKALWRQGRDAAWIAHAFGEGLTPNAVRAKIRRLGLSKPRETENAPARIAAPLAPGPVLTPQDGEVSILTVRRCDCRWPLGDPRSPAFRLCGGPVHRGGYCAAHAAVAYRGAIGSFDDLMRWAGLA